MNFKCLKGKELGVWAALKIKVLETFLQKDQTEKLNVSPLIFTPHDSFLSSALLNC